jgi:hypothetical protein
MTDWIADLEGLEDLNDDAPALELDALKSLVPQTKGARRKIEIELTDDRTITRRSAKREYQHLLHVKNAAKSLRKLPEKGSSLHCIMRGNYNAWDLVPAVLKQIAPKRIKTLWVATLGFNLQNAEELIALLDSKQIGRCEFICSCYFRSTTSELFDLIHHQLATRGSRAVAIRSHAKILLIETTDRRYFAVESSANLRSCNNIEQFCMTHDRRLFRFHADWMRTVIEKSEAYQ